MRYLSVCSGIEAASVAWESLGWTPVAFAEIEQFPSQVLAHHFPGVPNLGDMTRYKEWDIDRGAVDLIVGGTPCQSFSVAGLRKGLEDPRGNLALTFLGMVDHFKPEWVIWENVPGVLSSSGGRDFGSFLGALGQLRYGFAYRVLDAQYFGVPQRRRRVFVVAHSSGDSRRAAEVLFEPESLRGNPTKSRAAGQETAQCLTTGTGCRYDPNTETLIPVMYDHHPQDSRINGPVDVSPHAINYVVESFAQNQLGELRTSPIASTLGTNSNASGRNTPMIIQPAHTFKIRGVGHYTGTNGGIAKPGTGGSGYMGQDEKAYTIATSQDQHLMQGMAVRRLTPTECERLQGFPDGWTDILPTTPDGPRYKAIGNSMAVPVMRWIGSRIQACR